MGRNPIAISNGVPATADNGDVVNCDVCHRAMVTDDVGGNFFTTDEPWWVCDGCGQRAAPDLWPLLLELRAAKGFTVTPVGARIDHDERAFECAICGRDLSEDLVREGWHVVDGRHGRPVCEHCEPERLHSLRSLAARLNLAMDPPIHNGPRGVQ
jgi:hypothetical protein